MALIDHLIITDIYEASEEPIENITSSLLVQKKKPIISYFYTHKITANLKLNLSLFFIEYGLLSLQGGKVNARH